MQLAEHWHGTLDQRKRKRKRREGGRERVERCLTKHRETQREEGLNERSRLRYSGQREGVTRCTGCCGNVLTEQKRSPVAIWDSLVSCASRVATSYPQRSVSSAVSDGSIPESERETAWGYRGNARLGDSRTLYSTHIYGGEPSEKLQRGGTNEKKQRFSVMRCRCWSNLFQIPGKQLSKGINRICCTSTKKIG